MPQDEQQIGMWSYWRDKYGPVVALKDYYAGVLAEDPMLQRAVAQIQDAEWTINHRMEELSDGES